MDLTLTEQDLVNMKLHERIVIDKTNQCHEWVLRVPGGWIYHRQSIATSTADNHGIALCAVFVPIANVSTADMHPMPIGAKATGPTGQEE